MTILTHKANNRITMRAAVVIGVTMMTLVASGCNNAQQAALSQSLINGARDSAGARPLGWDTTAANKAQAWADHMAAVYSLSHSNLSDGMGGGWTYLGENVAVASSVADAHNALMRSPGHRANILASKFTSVGVGVSERNGQVFVAQVFRG